uniref:G_PROTEIN_RECEP_F1_2 domain-containing protein n=1 Tax=Schistosoma mansoni TaxID=6183 RepID=A0A5K4F147_SCHMA
MVNRSDWLFVDSPWDLLEDCENFYNGLSNDYIMCITSSILGFLSAYIFPIYSIFGIISNILIAIIFIYIIPNSSRQMIYMGTLAITDALTQILFGWLWVFPSKGLPYATLGNVYLFTFNISEDLCRLHRFAYSFTCALGGNLLILMAIDRCLCIYMPIKYNKIPKHYAWYLISIIIIITCLLMLPYGIVVGWHLSNNLLICWLNYDDLFLNIYHAFVSDSCLIQLIIVMGCNIAFMIKLHKLLKNRRQFMKNSEEKKELSASIVLVILCVTTLIASLPQSIAYIISFILPSIIMDPMELRGPLRLVYNIADIFWHLIFIQTSCNIFIYAVRIKKFRHILLHLLKCHYLRHISYSTYSGECSTKVPTKTTGN